MNVYRLSNRTNTSIIYVVTFRHKIARSQHQSSVNATYSQINKYTWNIQRHTHRQHTHTNTHTRTHIVRRKHINAKTVCLNIEKQIVSSKTYFVEHNILPFYCSNTVTSLSFTYFSSSNHRYFSIPFVYFDIILN